MERLTYKTYIEGYAVNFEKSSDRSWSIAESDTHIKVTGEPIEKLGELEDMLEEFELTSAEELRKYKNYKGNMAILEGELNYKNKITDLQHEKEIIQKALDLACQTLYDINFQLYNTEMDFKEYFKQQAKEMLESE